MSPLPTPLDDQTLQRFLRDGYITLDPGLDTAFHRELFEEVDGLFDNEANPGNNILPRVPAIRRVLDSPPVHGALQGLLGGDDALVGGPQSYPRRAGLRFYLTLNALELFFARVVFGPGTPNSRRTRATRSASRFGVSPTRSLTAV